MNNFFKFSYNIAKVFLSNNLKNKFARERKTYH